MQEQFEKIRFHFMHAMDLEDAHARDSYIEHACRSHPEICERLQSMYQAHRSLEGMEESEVSGLETKAEDTDFGNNIDVIEKIAEGGFGVVYLAREEKPLNRLVAVKVLKSGMDSDEILTRFRTEQGALAIMNHRCISKVLGSGASGSGRPFFIMEYVDGVFITDYCDQNKLSLDQRLELFCDACDAIAHAHQNGVIHRDIKPSNILVTEIDGARVPKVIDFGIAKALSPELKADSFKTKQFRLVGSPLYMSPEQAGRKEFPIDTRTDIYSMGSLLYLLVAGVPAFDPDRLSSVDILSTLEIIREEDVLSLSDRFERLDSSTQIECARQRRNSLAEQVSALKGEISWIVGKAIEKNPDDRYQSILELKQDVQNYLDNRPLQARPTSNLYLTRKFIQRNWLGVSLFSAILLIIVGALFFSLWQLKRATDAEELAGLRLGVAQKAQGETQAALTEKSKSEQEARRISYASDIRLAASEEEEGDVISAFEILQEHVPGKTTNSQDYRGFEWYFLSRTIERDCTVIQESFDQCSSVLNLPDQDLVCIGHYSGMVTLRDSQTGKLIARHFAHQGMVNGMDFLPERKWLASVGDDEMVHIWDVAQRKTVKTFKCDKWHAERVFFLADNRRIITSGGEPAVKIWDLETGELLDELDGIELGIVGKLALSADRKHVVTWPVHKIVSVFRLDGENQTIPFQSMDIRSDPRCLAISGDGRLVAIGHRDFLISLWDTQTGKRLNEFKGHRDDIQFLDFHPNGRMLASADRSGIVRFWNTAVFTADVNSELSQWPRAMVAHRDRIWAIDFSQDGKRLLTASRDGMVKSWRGRKSKRLSFEPDSFLVQSCWKNDRELLYSEKNRLFVWDVATNSTRVVKELPSLIRAIDVDLDNQLTAIGTQTGKVWVLGEDSNQLVQEIDAHASKSVYDVKFVPGEKPGLVTTGNDRRAVYWDVLTGKPRAEHKRDRDFDDIALIPGHNAVLLCFQNDVWRWDLTNDQLFKHLTGHLNSVESVVVLNDGESVVTGSDDRTIRVWDLKSGKPRETIRGHDYKLYKVDCLPKLDTIVAGDDDGFLSFSNAENGRFLMKYDLKRFWPQFSDNKFNEIRDISISPDGTQLAMTLANIGILIVDIRLAE